MKGKYADSFLFPLPLFIILYCKSPFSGRLVGRGRRRSNGKKGGTKMGLNLIHSFRLLFSSSAVSLKPKGGAGKKRNTVVVIKAFT